MFSCTFFGHRDCPNDIYVNIKSIIKNLILHEGISIFYVGDNGNFDLMVYEALNELKKEYDHIEFWVVVAYLSNAYKTEKPTLFPQGIETVPKKFAIPFRNNWMLKQCDYVVCYVERSWGGAAKFVDLAKKQGKKVINLALKNDA